MFVVKYCDKCKTHIVGKRITCPLCQGLLSEEAEVKDEIFPSISTIYKQHNLFFKIMFLISIIIATISVAVNVMIIDNSAWSLFVLGGLLGFWISLSNAINKRNNIPKNIVYQVMIMSIIAIILDYETGQKGWSINYVIPLICVLAMISMAIITKIMKLHIEDYIIYLIIDGLFGIIPLILFLFGMLDVLYPSLICIITSIISLSTILIFEGESMREEIKKRFHV